MPPVMVSDTSVSLSSSTRKRAGASDGSAPRQRTRYAPGVDPAIETVWRKAALASSAVDRSVLDDDPSRSTAPVDRGTSSISQASPPQRVLNWKTSGLRGPRYRPAISREAVRRRKPSDDAAHRLT